MNKHVGTKKRGWGGTRVAQWVERPTSAQVMISQLTSSSPASGSVRTARSLEPASDSVSPSLSAPLPLTLCLLKINKCLKKIFLSLKSRIYGAPGWFRRLSVRLLISAQVMISQFMRSSPASGSALTVWSLLGILSPSLSFTLLHTCMCTLFLSLSLSQKIQQYILAYVVPVQRLQSCLLKEGQCVWNTSEMATGCGRYSVEVF